MQELIKEKHLSFKRYYANSLIVFFVFLCCSSCKEEIDESLWISPMSQYNDSLILQQISSKEFVLDSSTILKYENFQYVEKENSVVSYNSVNSELLCFDYNTCKLKWKLDLKALKISPRRKGVMKSYNFFVASFDSIFFYDNDRSKVLLFDTAQTILKEYKVASKMNMYSKGSPRPGEVLAVSRDSIYISSAPGNRNTSIMHAPLNENILLAISIKDGNSKPIISYPEIYRKAVWGSYFHAFYCVYNDKLNKIILSFPMTYNLAGYNTTTGEIDQFYAGSNRITKVSPLFFSNRSGPVNEKDDIRNFLIQPSYKQIIYDRFRNVYYRFASSGIPKDDFKVSQSPGYKFVPMSIIILNGDLKKVGEVPLDANKYSPLSMFISEEGLCIPLKKSNDEAIFFDIFSIKTK